jgi:D-alanyl-D-alanine carboxypeptidase
MPECVEQNLTRTDDNMNCKLRIVLLVALIILPISPISVLTSFDVEARQYRKATRSASLANYKHRHNYSRKLSSTVTQERFSALVVNADNGHILYEKNAGGTRYPASLTKMMTLYLTFDALKKGKLDIGDTLPISEKAASQPQTNISLNAGDHLPVKTAIESVIVRSANDSATVLAEALGGTTWNFALMMTQKARALGMKDTVFRNPNGLPDDQQHTTAYDMAKLGIALRRDFPKYYPMFKMQSFSYDGITYPGHNRVMQRYAGADGIKTGYIHASGYNLVTSVKKNGYNLVAVIMGGNSATARDNAMINMLDRTFAQLENKQKIMSKNQDIKSENAVKSSENTSLARAF